MEHGLACNTGGGTHHAFPTYGSGFCLINDLAIAAKFMQHHGKAKRVLIVDLDVHQASHAHNRYMQMRNTIVVKIVLFPEL